MAALISVTSTSASAKETDPRADALNPDVWRREHRIVDMHMHIAAAPERFERALRVMNAAGVGMAIELGSGTVTPKADGLSDFERTKQAAKAVAPGRFLHYMILDYSGWDDPDWSERAAAQITRGKELGAVGLKEFKRLGLTLRDGKGQLIKVDDPKLDAVWKRCGELGMPVSIHVGDPKAFWEPLNPSNERWAELKDHPSWWFGDPNKYPPRMEVVEALSRVIARHPQTTILGVHFANNPEEIDWVDDQLTAHANIRADVAARLPEIGRQDPATLRRLFEKHQDKILFGTDFQVHNRMILGSSGDDERPTELEALVFFQKCYRFFETSDRNWPHMTPIQGDWTISSIDLDRRALRKVYFDNARRMLAPSWPLPTTQARRIDRDFSPDGRLDEPAWGLTPLARIEYSLKESIAHPDLSTSVRLLWSDNYLYLAYEAPYTELAMRENPPQQERLGLWEDDVVEVFIAPDPEQITRYTEYEWAPNGEQLDLRIDLPEKDFAWSSGMESAVVIDKEQKIYRVEARIPMKSITPLSPQPGTRWRVNFYRNDNASGAFLAWNPTLTSTAHTPEKMGWLELVE